jgi:DNA-binding LytR/AlgR family response regulator
MNQLPQTPDPDKYLSVLWGQVHLLISDIIRLEGDRNYTRFVMADGRRILTAKNLGAYELCLPSIFIRVHKRYMINLLWVIDSEADCLYMGDGCKVQIARRKRGNGRNG